MIIFDVDSIPLLTPRNTINADTARKITNVIIGSHCDVMNPVKNPSCAASAPCPWRWHHFTLIYKAAKYISDGAKHARARKYADAALGKYNETELMSEIEAKRNKDLLMAVGILPIVDETQIKERYMFLQEFKKESKQFGAQRRASEAAAVQRSLSLQSPRQRLKTIVRIIATTKKTV